MFNAIKGLETGDRLGGTDLSPVSIGQMANRRNCASGI